jgi:hypothetical protein
VHINFRYTALFLIQFSHLTCCYNLPVTADSHAYEIISLDVIKLLFKGLDIHLYPQGCSDVDAGCTFSIVLELITHLVSDILIADAPGIL